MLDAFTISQLEISAHMNVRREHESKELTLILMVAQKVQREYGLTLAGWLREKYPNVAPLPVIGHVDLEYPDSVKQP